MNDEPEIKASVDALIGAAQARLTTVDNEISGERQQRKWSNQHIKELLAEKARLDRIVRASQPRKPKAAS